MYLFKLYSEDASVVCLESFCLSGFKFVFFSLSQGQ